MSTPHFMRDPAFDALVEAMHALANRGAEAARVDRWEIRLALGLHGVLPLRTAASELEQSLVSSLRAMTRIVPATSQAA